MTKFIAQLNDHSYINTPADRMIKEDNIIMPARRNVNE